MEGTRSTPEDPDCIENHAAGSSENEAIPLDDQPRRYLLHHVNNNLTVLKGNLNYLLRLAERLEDVDTRTPEDRELLNRLENAIQTTVRPMIDSVKTLFRVTRAVASVLKDGPKK